MPPRHLSMNPGHIRFGGRVPYRRPAVLGVVHPGKFVILQVAIQIIPGRMVAKIYSVRAFVIWIEKNAHGRSHMSAILVPGVLAGDGDDPAGGLSAVALDFLLLPVDQVLGDVVRRAFEIGCDHRSTAMRILFPVVVSG